MFSPLGFPRDGANIFFALTFVPPPRVSLAPIDCALLMFHCENIKFETGFRLKLRITFHLADDLLVYVRYELSFWQDPKRDVSPGRGVGHSMRPP